jgi:hypothetical protein
VQSRPFAVSNGQAVEQNGAEADKSERSRPLIGPRLGASGLLVILASLGLPSQKLYNHRILLFEKPLEIDRIAALIS